MFRPPVKPWAVVLVLAGALGAQEWRYYGGDQGGSKYSPLDQINRENAARLRPAWEWKSGEKPIPDLHVTPGMFEATPLMIGNRLYLSTPLNRVVALDAESGVQLW